MPMPIRQRQDLDVIPPYRELIYREPTYISERKLASQKKEYEKKQRAIELAEQNKLKTKRNRLEEIEDF